MDPRLIAANAAFAQGRKAEAVDHIIAALRDGVTATVDIYSVLLRNLVQLGRYADGVFWGEKALELAPKNYDLLNICGVCLRRVGRYAQAIELFDRAIKLKPNETPALINKGNVLNDQQNGPAAEAVFTKLVRRDPRNSEFQRQLGRALWSQRKLDGAAKRMRHAIALKKDNQDAWLDLAAVIADGGDLEAALAANESALALAPEAPRVLQAKATLLRRMARTADAEKLLATILQRSPGAAWAHIELARLYADIDRRRANTHFREAVALDPGNVDYRFYLAESLDRTRGDDEADNIEEAYQVLKGTNLGGPLESSQAKVAAELLTRSADYEAAESIGSFEQLGRQWAQNGQHTALLQHMPRVRTPADRREMIRFHRSWGELSADRAQRNPIVRPATPRSGGKIRLGFMSSDLREHPVTYFAWPLFEHADRDRFEIYCYSFFRGGEADPLQQQLAKMVDIFRWHPFISDRDAAQMIANDQIDILFELGGTTYMNKLDVMAWKPARLGASWLGYPHSSGLKEIDYLLVDPFLTPPDPALLIEKPLVMPRSWIAMGERAFPDRHRIEPQPPVLRNGFVSFGTANNPYKYNAEMIRTWARIVATVPGSRFVFIRPEGGSPSFVRNMRARFEAEGVASDRIDFQAVRGLHMPHYNEIDIALDTFPQTGGTTTCEAAWMGVPTVTLVGEALFERLSHSILQNAGLGDLCAASREEYVETAVRLAADVDRIASLRTGLRDQLRASPLGATRQFARDFYDLIASTVR